MGGPDIKRTPTASEIAQQSIQSQINLLPQQLQAEQQFAPQFAEQSLQVSREFAPQFLQQQLEQQREFAPQFAEQLLAERELLTPEAVAGGRAATDFLEGGQARTFAESQQSALDEFLSPTEEVLSPFQKRSLEQDIRSAQNVRGFGIASPLGSVEETGALENLRQQIRGQRFQARTGVASSIFGGQQQLANLGLSATSRAPSGFRDFGSTFQAPTPTLTSGLSGGQFGNIALQQAQLEQQKAQIEGSNPFSSIAGTVLGSFGGGFGGSLGSRFGSGSSGGAGSSGSFGDISIAGLGSGRFSPIG